MGLFRSAIGTLLLVAAAYLAEISAIDAYIEAEMSLNDIPGAAVSVWSKGGIIYAKGFGVRSTATNMAMAADTLIDLASVSKSLTGVAVDKLNRQGRIDLDAPVTKYLPELGDPFGRVKIRHLLRHSSGLTRRDDASVTCCGLAAETGLDEAAQELSSAKPSPGVEFVYANSNYVLLAAVLERVSGQPFPVLMQQLVFRPLGMRRTTLDVAEARRWGMADPHCCFGGEVQPDPSQFLGWYGSSLVKSTAQDMATYLGWVLSNAGRGWSEPYDRGWFLRRRQEWLAKPFVLEHGGNTSGGNTAALVVPAWQLGVVVLLNSGVNRAVDIARGVAPATWGSPHRRRGSNERGSAPEKGSSTKRTLPSRLQI